MRAQRSTAGVIGMLTVLALAAPRLASGAPADACSLLTQAQVAAALGVTVGAGQGGGKALPVAGPGGETWHEADGGRQHPGRQGVRLCEKTVDQSNAVKTAAPGVGDDAVFNTIGVATTT